MQLEPTGATLSSQAADREVCEKDASDLDIELDDRAGLVRVNDARLFHTCAASVREAAAGGPVRSSRSEEGRDRPRVVDVSR